MMEFADAEERNGVSGNNGNGILIEGWSNINLLDSRADVCRDDSRCDSIVHCAAGGLLRSGTGSTWELGTTTMLSPVVVANYTLCDPPELCR